MRPKQYPYRKPKFSISVGQIDSRQIKTDGIYDRGGLVRIPLEDVLETMSMTACK